MKWGKILLIIAVPLFALGLALASMGTAMACPDGPTTIGPDGGIVVPGSGDSAATMEAGTTPAVAAQTSTSTASFVIPLAAAVSCLAIAAFVLRKRIYSKTNPRSSDLVASPAAGHN